MVSINKKLVFGLFVLFVLLSLQACSAKTSVSETQTPVTVTDSSWAITLIHWEIADDLKGTQSAQQYNGDVIQNEISESPSEGNTFLLVELTIGKQTTGASSFIWKQLYITDENDTKYYRLANDTFLKNYNFPRIKSTDLTIGTNRGFIVFEIPKSASKQSLSLVYDSAEGTVKIPLAQ